MGLWAAMALALSGGTAHAEEPETPLNEAGQKLLGRYTDMLTALKTEIAATLPKLDEQKKASCIKAYRDGAVASAAELAALRAQDGKPETETARKNYEAAKETLTLAKTNALARSKAILDDLREFLADNKLDGQSAKRVPLTEATPRGWRSSSSRARRRRLWWKTSWPTMAGGSRLSRLRSPW